MYVTEKMTDFDGEEGEKLEKYFKNVFLHQYLKYKKIIDSVVPDEAYVQRVN